jgi:hypothetical protein
MQQSTTTVEDMTELPLQEWNVTVKNLPSLLCNLSEKYYTKQRFISTCKGTQLTVTHQFDYGFAVWQWTTFWLPDQNIGCWNLTVSLQRSILYITSSLLGYMSYKRKLPKSLSSSAYGSVFKCFYWLLVRFFLILICIVKKKQSSVKTQYSILTRKSHDSPLSYCKTRAKTKGTINQIPLLVRSTIYFSAY